MSVIRSPLRSPIYSPLYNPLAGKWAASGGDPVPEPFTVVDALTSTTASLTPTFSSRALGDADANRWIVVEISFANSSFGWAGNNDITGMVVNGVTMTLCARVVQSGSGATAIFMGNVPDDATGDIAVTCVGTVTPNRWAVNVYRGIGPFSLDSASSVAGVGGSLTLPGGNLKFAVSSIHDAGADTSISGLEMQAANVATSNLRSSFAHEIAAGAATIGTVEANKLSAIGLVAGNRALNIALVAADTSHASATNTKADLEDFGHTVTLVDDADIGTTDFSSYDLIVALRLTGTADATDSTVASGLRTLSDNGKPIVAGATAAGMTAGTGKTTLATAFNLTGTWRIMNSTDGGSELVITDNEHAITDGFAEATYAVYSAANFMGTVTTGQSTVGTSLATGDPDEAGAGEIALIAVEAGTTDLAAGTTGARIIVGDFPYAGQSRHTELGKALLNRMSQWAAGNI